MNISGNKLKKIRLEHKLKQYQMADMLGITASYVSKLEKAEMSSVSENLIRSICSSFNMNRDDLLTGEEIPDPIKIAPGPVTEVPLPYSNNKAALIEKVHEVLDSGSSQAGILRSQIIEIYETMKMKAEMRKQLDKMKENAKRKNNCA